MDSFLDFYPTTAVVLNTELDHVDYFKSIEQMCHSYTRFCDQCGAGGTVIGNADDPQTAAVLGRCVCRRVTFGIDADADYRAADVRRETDGQSFVLICRGEVLGRITLRVTGRHNVYNALAAAAAASVCGIAPELIAKSLEAFAGANRRMECKGTLNGAAVYDDYGHHPVEIQATLTGAREMGYKRILCAYQPHTYSRTATLFEEFANAFGSADRVYFADIYAAREQNVFGVSSQGLAQRIGDRAEYCGSFEGVAEALERDAKEGDLVIVMGAGDIYKVYDLLNLKKF
jgi:UDP-N-acetylmuramate--alanine ligase